MESLINDRLLFRRCFIICTFFQTIAFVEYISYLFTAILFFWGTYLLGKYYIKEKNYKTVEYSKYFTIFAIISLVTLIFNIFSSPLSSFVTLCTSTFNLMYFFLFFGSHIEDISSLKKELYVIAKAVILITLICAIVGLVLLIVFHRAIWIFGKSLIIFENRFKGIYINPNPQAFASFTGIFSCALLRCKPFLQSIDKKMISRKLAYSCIGINVLTLMLSVSNAGLLILATFLFGCVCFRIFLGNNFKSGRKIAYKTMIFLICCAVILTGLLLTRNGVNYISGVLISGTPIVSEDIFAPTNEQYSSELQPENDNITFEHINNTIDSGRLKLYNKALKAITQNPIIGMGYGNIFSIGFESGRLFDYHNGFLTIAVSNGVLALITLLIFGLTLGSQMIKVAFTVKNGIHSKILSLLISFICAYCVYACVEPTLLYYPTYMVSYFWLILGSAFALIYDFENKRT